jgi:hypothetical protein
MDIFPVIFKDEGIVKVSFGNVPIWNGVQKSPGEQKYRSIELSAHQGLIAQCATSQVVSAVVDRYKADEYKFITPPPGSSEWANSLGDSKLRAVEKVIGDGMRPCNILEIGAGSTWVANKLLEKYDPDSYVIVDPTIQEPSEKVEVIREYFPNSKIAGRHFDFIVGFSVLEHVPDPILFLNNMVKHLSRDGVIMLVYPDCEEQLQKGDINVIVHEHLSYFTEASSRWLASTCGLEIIFLESENDCFTLALCQSSIGLSHENVLDQSELLMESVKSFQSLFGPLKNRVDECLEAGGTVGFHGATNGLNTFLHMTGLGGRSNIYIYDGDKSKVGFYLPACSSPIMHPTEGSYAGHSLIVISAMSFVGSISNFAINEVGMDKSQILSLVGLELLN